MEAVRPKRSWKLHHFFLTVTGSAGTQNITYSQWTVVFFFGFKYSYLLFFLYNQSQAQDFIGLAFLTLINIPKIKSDELKNKFDYLPNIFIILREKVYSWFASISSSSFKLTVSSSTIRILNSFIFFYFRLELIYNELF